MEATEHQKNHTRNTRMNGMLKIASSLLLPMMLGIFTVVITFHQQNVSKQQRLEDRQLAREQREQDLNLSSLQRAQDKEDARLQREQDLTIARLQREEDQRRREQDLNLSEIQRQEQRIQRQQDLEIAQNKLIQEKNLTEQQQRIAEQQRIHEVDIEQKRYWDGVLNNYIKEIGQFLRVYNGSLTGDPLIATLIRIKTLTVVRQLSPAHNVQLLQFLYEAGQLTGKNPLDISTAQFYDIDLSQPNVGLSLRYISLVGVHFRNASFVGCDLTGADFRHTNIDLASFSEATLHFAQFSYSTMKNITMNRVFAEHVNWTGARLEEVHVARPIMVHNIFEKSGIVATIINDSEMDHTNFAACSCIYNRVRNTLLNDANFSGAVIDNSIFSHCHLNRVNFYKVSAQSVDFSRSSLKMSNFSHSILNKANLSNSIASEVDFSYATMDEVDCLLMKATESTFFRASLNHAILLHVQAPAGNFSHARMGKTVLSGAILHITSFVEARLNEAMLGFATVTGANFSLADLRNAHFREDFFENIVSLRGAQLTGTSYARNPNIISNGYADCKIPIKQYWTVEDEDVLVVNDRENKTNCMFITNSTLGAYFIQRFNFFETKFSGLFAAKRVVLILTARFGNTTSVGLQWGDDDNTAETRKLSKL